MIALESNTRYNASKTLFMFTSAIIITKGSKIEHFEDTNEVELFCDGLL